MNMSTSKMCRPAPARCCTTPGMAALYVAMRALKDPDAFPAADLGLLAHIGQTEYEAGYGGGERMAEENNVDFLGALPLDKRIREETDGGKPTVVAEPEARISQIYREIARRTAAKLSLKSKDYAARFPQIVISND